jgi:hypothetical protein
MPNPIDSVGGLWVSTWLLQVMPLFFIVGGFANAASLSAEQRDGRATADWLATRLGRLARPLAPLLLFWVAFDLAAIGSGLTDRSVWQWGDVVFVPLWFIGAYGAVTLLTPVTMRGDRALGAVAPLATGLLIIAGDLMRFHLGIEAAGIANSLLVFVFAAQLGHRWQGAARDPRHRSGVAAAGVAALVAMTALGPYPTSMVATSSGAMSNMFPTTAAVAALALMQFGLVRCFAPHLERLVARRPVWRATIAVNAVAITVFTWHMTALVATLALWSLSGQTLLADPSTTWWLQRPLFVALPALILAPLVITFARLELRSITGPSRP